MTLTAKNETLSDTLGTLHYSYLCPPLPPAGNITIIGGYSRSHKDFLLWQRKLAELGYAVLLLDTRGSGDSRATQSFSFLQHTKDILSVWKHLGIAKSSVIGFSMGGLIAQSLASLHPQAIAGLVLISTLATKDDFAPLKPHPITGESPLWHPLDQYFSSQYSQRRPTAADTLKKDIARLEASTSKLTQLHYQRNAFASAPFESINHSLISASTLIIHGDDDKIISFHGAKKLAQNIASSTLILYPHCGHLLLLENPKQLYTDVSHFLKTRTQL